MIYLHRNSAFIKTYLKTQESKKKNKNKNKKTKTSKSPRVCNRRKKGTIKKGQLGAGEMVQSVRALAAL